MVLAKASAFICATISTSPDPASVATQVTRPSASNFGVSLAPSSSSALVPDAANGEDTKQNLRRFRGVSLGALALGWRAAHKRDKADVMFGTVAERAKKSSRYRR